MRNNSGKIYELDDGTFGVAINREQHPSFASIKKIYLHVYEDRLCTIKKKNPKDNKNLVTLKAVDKCKFIGFQD